MTRSLSTSLKEAVTEFNRYHGQEMRARLRRVEGDLLFVEFDGWSCRSCGGQDYLEDFAFEASDGLQRTVELLRFERRGEWGYVGTYRLLDRGRSEGKTGQGPSD